MKAISHKVNHFYQPTKDTCGYAALSTFLSYYDISMQPWELVAEVSQPKDSEGNPQGSVTAQLVEWCQSKKMQTRMYASDCLVLDLSWQEFDSAKLLKRLKAIREIRNVPALGDKWSKIYIDAYIAMLNAGGKLEITSFISTKLLYGLLEKSPVYVNVCSTALRGKGRGTSFVEGEIRKTTLDDINGSVNTHSVVVYGNDEQGNYLVSDPWEGRTVVEPETMVCAIEAAQIECDNQCFIVESNA